MKERMQNEDAERSAVDDLEVRPIDAEMRKDLSEEKLSHETIAGSEQHSSSSIHEEKQDVENSPDLSQGDCPPTEVSRSQRRGLFGRFTVIAEVQEPKHYSRKIKWFITFVIALAAVAAPLGSAIIFPSLHQISQDFHTNPTVVNLTSALYMFSMAIFPLWWSSFSESFGRRSIYLISFTLFLVFNILSAVSVNIAMLIVMRILGGGAAASVQAVGAGTIADIWEPKERGTAMGMFYLGPLMGPFLAPIIGGALAQGLGWRSTQWFLAIYGAVVLIFLFFALPETLKSTEPKVSTMDRTTSHTSAPSVAVHSKRIAKALRRFFIEPLFTILYLRYPAVFLTVYYASITFGALYLLNISIEVTFSRAPYNYSTLIIGILYIPNSLGYILSSLLCGRWTDHIMAREARRAGRFDPQTSKLIYRPEDRMRENAWIAAILYPCSLIWYGWTAQRGTFWLAPLIANFFFGVGSMVIFATVTTMLTEFMPRKASAGVAANNFVRNTFSAIGAVVAQPLIEVIGNGWLFTLVGLVAAGSSVVVWAMRHYGPRWRERMSRELG